MVDVRDSKAVDGWVAKTVADHGRLDAAANIAGVYRNNVRLVDETDEGFHFHMDVNSTGLFYCLRAQLQALSKGGSIVSHTKIPCRGDRNEKWTVELHDSLL